MFQIQHYSSKEISYILKNTNTDFFINYLIVRGDELDLLVVLDCLTDRTKEWFLEEYLNQKRKGFPYRKYEESHLNTIGSPINIFEEDFNNYLEEYHRSMKKCCSNLLKVVRYLKYINNGIQKI